MEQIEQTKKLITDKRLQVLEIDQEIRELERRLLELKTGLKEGDLVQDDKGQKGILVFVPQWTTWWHWRKLKKDGTPAKNSCSCGHNAKLQKVTE